jgi:hypothetical protein
MKKATRLMLVAPGTLHMLTTIKYFIKGTKGATIKRVDEGQPYLVQGR